MTTPASCEPQGYDLGLLMSLLSQVSDDRLTVTHEGHELRAVHFVSTVGVGYRVVLDFTRHRPLVGALSVAWCVANLPVRPETGDVTTYARSGEDRVERPITGFHATNLRRPSSTPTLVIETAR